MRNAAGKAPMSGTCEPGTVRGRGGETGQLQNNAKPSRRDACGGVEGVPTDDGGQERASREELKRRGR